jgi:hypothetical protein
MVQPCRFAKVSIEVPQADVVAVDGLLSEASKRGIFAGKKL